MNYEEFKRHIGKAGLKINSFAQLLGLRQSSLTNYSKGGEVPNHLAIIAFLMGEMADNKLDFKTKIENLELKKPIIRPRAFGKDKKREDNSEK